MTADTAISLYYEKTNENDSVVEGIADSWIGY
jgi:hypothetical protein